MNKEKIYNLKNIDQIAHLENGWNGNNAKAFEQSLITKVRKIITALELQPELFPTACGSIQIEYEKKDGSYLEIEINTTGTCEVFKIDSNGIEIYSSIPDNIESIANVVRNFYG